MKGRQQELQKLAIVEGFGAGAQEAGTAVEAAGAVVGGAGIRRERRVRQGEAEGAGRAFEAHAPVRRSLAIRPSTTASSAPQTAPHSHRFR